MFKDTTAEILLLISKLCILLICWNSLTEISGVAGETATADLTLTKEEKLSLDKLRSRVLPLLSQAYMKHDLFLIRWLRARNLDVDKAEKMLKSNLEWRRNQKIDSILQEDWSDMVEDYPYTNNTFDKAGRPIMTVSIGSWDVRQATVAGKGANLVRYLNKIYEELRVRVIEEQKKGKAVTRWTGIMNLDGFNPVQHACPLCFPMYLSILEFVENRYPEEINKIYFINTPSIFRIVTDVLHPVMTPALRKSLVYLGQDKSQWMKQLDEEISKEERTPEFGGTLSA